MTERCRTCGDEAGEHVPYGLPGLCATCWKKRRADAWATYNRALRRGLLARLPCDRCGTEPAEGHHTDYRQPLRVTFLCTNHHRARHEADRREWERRADTASQTSGQGG